LVLDGASRLLEKLMGHEFIGECSPSGEGPELDDYDMELAIKYIKQECGHPPAESTSKLLWKITNSAAIP
jgi:hypothetical protein